jgi:hypothetical protein
VSPKVYWVYITQVYGVALVVLLVLIQWVLQIHKIFNDYWLVHETSEIRTSFNA